MTEPPPSLPWDEQTTRDAHETHLTISSPFSSRHRGDGGLYLLHQVIRTELGVIRATTSGDSLKYTQFIFLFILSFLVLSCNDNRITPPDELVLYSDLSPAWSPDGRWIAYYHEDYSNDTSYPTGLYIIDTSGNNRRLLIRGYADSPDWSPDGKWIAFRVGAIYAVSFEGDSIRRITPFTAHFPGWSPDGKKIVFDTRYQHPDDGNVIWIIDADGTNLRDISQRGVGEWRTPHWSPDGLRIVHLRYIGVGFSEIFTMDTSAEQRRE